VSGGQYVAAAYGVVFVVVLAYVAIIAAKLQRLQRQTADLVELARAKPSETRSTEPIPREAPLEAHHEA
jgi:CcmD family protein